MKTRTTWVVSTVLACITPIAAACGSEAASNEQSIPAASTPQQAALPPSTATVSAPETDEQQIRGLYAQMSSVFGSWDGQQAANLTCAKFREKALHVFDNAAPPISAFGSPEQLKATGVDQLTVNLAPKFSPASEPAVRQVAQALVANDTNAYSAAMRQVMKEGSSITVDKVDNIVINGDTATADSTTTRKAFTQPAQTQISHDQLVRENGQWKDCSPPESQ